MLAGKYRLAERVAQGGMGSVWRAEHLQLHMPVAVKLMAPKMLGSDAFRVRFEREARAVAQLRSRHVVTVHDYGFDGDEPFLVMELLDGEDLAARLRRERKISPETTALVVGQIARALERAHAAGLVHRDLKPGNVFLARIDDEEVVKVLDFGIAKAFGDGASDDVTGDDEVLGTPHYMSPEQIRKVSAIDPRADLWAVGVIAYRMLTGSLPFNGETRGDVVVRVCSEPAVPPSVRDPSLGRAVDLFFERALAKLPEERFESARALTAALDHALGIGQAGHTTWARGSIPDILPASLAAAAAAGGTFPPGSLPPGAATNATPPPGSLPPGSLPPGSLPPGNPPAAFGGSPIPLPSGFPMNPSATFPPPAPPVFLPAPAPATRTPLPAVPAGSATPGRDGSDTTLSLQPTLVHPSPHEPARSRRRLALGGLALAVLLAGVAVPVGLGVLGGAGDPAAEAGASADPTPSANPATPSSGTAAPPATDPSAEPATEPSADPSPAASAEPSTEATAEPSASASVSAAPAAPARPYPGKRRRVQIGL